VLKYYLAKNYFFTLEFEIGVVGIHSSIEDCTY
jgi:hypothetical protein